MCSSMAKLILYKNGTNIQKGGSLDQVKPFLYHLSVHLSVFTAAFMSFGAPFWDHNTEITLFEKVA